MKRLLQILGFLLLFVLLTVLTQIGGVLLLLCLPLFRILHRRIPQKGKRRGAKVGTFLGVYLLTSFLLIPPLAKLNGRVPLPFFGEEHLKPLNAGTYLLNRQYVRPAMKQLLLEAAEEMQQSHPGSIVDYLDACHPFGNGYPLIPHLSHKDGKKVDIAFFYQKKKDKSPVNRRAITWIGYGGCELPKQGEYDQPSACEAKGNWQYSLLKQLSLGIPGRNLAFDPTRTKVLLRILAKDKQTGKIFLEPHLKTRLGLGNYPKIRFHGCHAVRHDDHIHVQL